MSITITQVVEATRSIGAAAMFDDTMDPRTAQALRDANETIYNFIRQIEEATQR